jgi:hypothetical protein
MKIKFLSLCALFVAITLSSCSNQESMEEVTADASVTTKTKSSNSQRAALRTLYVSTTGLDTSSGSSDQPFKTINKAAQVAIAGDLIIVRQGTYKPTTRITVANSGTTLDPITFKTEGVVTIDGVNCTDGNSSDRKGLFSVEGTSTSSLKYVTIDGFNIINAKWSGFFMFYSSGITVKNCTTKNTGSSGIIAAKSSYIYIYYNKVHSACNISSATTYTNECITVASVTDFEIAYNTVSDRPVDVNLGGEGIDAKNSCSKGKIYKNEVFNLYRVAIYVDSYDGTLNDIDVFGNKVYNTTSGITVASEGVGVANDVRVHDNLVYDIQKIGIRLAGYELNGTLKNISVYQNTVVRCGLGKTVNDYENCGILLEANNTSNINFIIINNILAESKSQMKWRNQSYATVDKNIVFGNTGYAGTNATITSPLFVSSSTANFALSTGSPAINTATGTPMSTLDFNRVSRGTSPDRGALEKI